MLSNVLNIYFWNIFVRQNAVLDKSRTRKLVSYEFSIFHDFFVNFMSFRDRKYCDVMQFETKKTDKRRKMKGSK